MAIAETYLWRSRLIEMTRKLRVWSLRVREVFWTVKDIYRDWQKGGEFRDVEGMYVKCTILYQRSIVKLISSAG